MKQLLLLIVCLFQIKLCASDHLLTMSELVEMALKNNPKTKKAWWQATKAKEAVGVAESSYYPTVDLTLSAEHGKEFQFINGPDTKYTELGANVLLSWLLFDFGERGTHVAAVREALHAASWQKNWDIQEVLLNTLESAYEVMHAKNAYKATVASLQDAQTLEQIAKAHYTAGVCPISDLYSSQALRAEMQMQEAKVEAEVAIKKAKLAAHLGLKDGQSLDLADIACLPIPQKKTDELITCAKFGRKDLMAKISEIKEAEHLIEKEEAQNAPKLTFHSQAGYTHFLHDKTKNATYELGIRLDMPIFSGFSSVYKKRQALATLEMRKSEKASLELKIAQEVLEYNLSLEAAQKRLALAESLHSNAEKAYQAVLEKYKAGKEKMFSEVTSAQSELARCRTIHSEVGCEWRLFAARLAYAIGSFPDSSENLCK